MSNEVGQGSHELLFLGKIDQGGKSDSSCSSPRNGYSLISYLTQGLAAGRHTSSIQPKT